MSRDKKNSQRWTAEKIRALARSRMSERDQEEKTLSLESSFHQSSAKGAVEDESLGRVAAPENSKAEFVWGPFEKSTGSRVLLILNFGASSFSGLKGQELTEIEQLCKSLGLEAVALHPLRRNFKAEPATFFGSGTMETLKKKIAELGAEALVVDHPLSPVQVRNLENELACPVLDRQAVILGIFKHHARSRLARLQVELAQLKYLQPRLAGMWMGLSRQRGAKGGMGGRGLGETRLELDRRVVKDRIDHLSAKLKEAERSVKVQSSKRADKLRVALVGYTNAGKSTLMRALTKAPVLARDELFSTLDTTVRPIQPPTHPVILLSDTVGFVRELPHDLVSSFKSTLSEAVSSSLLLLVIDGSDEDRRTQLDCTLEVLAEIGAGEIPKLFVLNKCDRLGSIERVRVAQLKRYLSETHSVEEPDVLALRALESESVQKLRSTIMHKLNAKEPEWSKAHYDKVSQEGTD